MVGSDVSLAELGEHELKGVPWTWKMFAVQERTSVRLNDVDPYASPP